MHGNYITPMPLGGTLGWRMALDPPATPLPPDPPVKKDAAPARNFLLRKREWMIVAGAGRVAFAATRKRR